VKARAILCFCAAMCALAGTTRADAPPASAKPNVLVILADDLGYSDLGCYGGEIETPNLDGLAAGGLRFSQFYNTARCWPSRAAILTGYYPQAVRRDAIPEVGGGAAGKRPKFARLLPDFLKPLGYRAYHSGKWHVDGMALAGGFDRSYLLVDQDRFFSPRVHFEDDKPLPAVQPDTGYYATVAIVDHAVKTLKDHAANHADKPFFHYLCFTCPHFPLQAMAEDVSRYRGKFAEGWDSLRPQRLARMQKAGLVTSDLSARTPGVPAWNSLAAHEQAEWQSRMEVHAAMVDRMDREIGRVLDQLRATNALDNTLIFFLSDNGASAEKLVRGDGDDPQAAPGSWRRFQCLEPPWANLANTPLRRSKIFVHEGGISTPLIVHWPNGIAARGDVRHNQGHVVDLVPTILQAAGGKKPQAWQGESLPPAPGVSLVPAFAADGSVTHDYLWWYHSGNRAIRIGDFKLVSEGKDGRWELYNLATDRAEMDDLASRNPFVAGELERAWQARLEEFRKLATQDGKGGEVDESAARKKKRSK
jgi:arylsulfatase